MAWNQMRPSIPELLNRQKGWENRGLAYWQKRVSDCQERVTKADSSSILGRALQDREIAEEAVRQLSKGSV